jgi:hypothetical protein
MTQELVDQIENQKFLKAQREAQEQADRKARLAFVPVSEEAVETPTKEGEPVSEEAMAPKKRGK